MKNKNKNSNTTQDTSSTNYELKSKAVDDLVSDETPEYSEEELNKYRSKSKIRIPDIVKVIFIKAWFAGAVCYFILWGLGEMLVSSLDMLFVLGVVLGMVTDLMINSIIRFIEATPGANDKWLLFPKKGMMSFFLNIVFSCVVIVCVFMIYNVLNFGINSITGNMDAVPIGVEPVLFGLLCMGVDMLFVCVRNVFKSIIADAKNAAKSQ